MKNHILDPSKATLCLILALLSSAAVTQAAPQVPPAKSGGKLYNAYRLVPEIEIPQSVFIIPSEPKEGRNPFFPESTTRVVVPRAPSNNQIDVSSFVLNGITSGPKRTAMINGRTFECGEEGEVKTAGGSRFLIKCEEIKAESAVIVVSGQRRELCLRSGA